MRQVALSLLLWMGTVAVGHAQTPAGAPQPPAKLSRKEQRALEKEQRDLDKKLAEAKAKRAAAPPLTEREREMSEALFVEGVKYVLLEDYNKGLEQLLKAYALNPDNAAVNYKIAEANLLSGNLRDAANYAEASIRLDSKNAYYYLLLAQIQASQKQYDNATKTYAALIKQVPNSGNYLFNLADLYLAQNKLPEALATLDQAEKEFGQVDEISFKKQQIFLKQNKLDLALAEGEKLIKANPTESRYVLAQAEMYASNNRLPDAVRVAQQALRLDPDNPQAHMILAQVYQQQNQPDEAGQQLKQAFASPALDIDERVRILVGYIKQLPSPKESVNQLARDLAAETIKTYPKDAKSYAVAGDIQTLTDHKKDARDTYLKALRFDNSKFQIWQQVVLIDAELSQTDSLLAHTDRALELFPNQSSLWFYNGAAHLLKKQPQKGVKALEHGRKLVVSNPELLGQFDAQLGDAYHELRLYEKSDAAYESALNSDPNNVQVLNNYSYFLSLRGEKLDKAKQMAGKVVKQYPDNDTYLDTYAWVLYKQKDYAGAKAALDKAMQTTKDGSIIEHYGDVLYQLGEKDKAVAEWQRAHKAGGTSNLLERKLKDHKLYE
ncbi:tetratricopeptide repeat protein [Hymenobacter properus]|uniref:Tetratricopeptide repeat protein n=1 Tax=Hymenobacter properus TaxID=2791026 RepID=A0A931BIY1_9BACT|nr:tetratricopeptide repeat protein [Hymenobacter properus]MBF9143153.1 tetratricopeptide repeat protein [Hymenobacter properus]MBR7721961.1 tetratricopeptide repeat protein [Microvirga sp. SRT04]